MVKCGLPNLLNRNRRPKKEKETQRKTHKTCRVAGEQLVGGISGWQKNVLKVLEYFVVGRTRVSCRLAAWDFFVF